MITYNKIFNSENEKHDFVLKCENDYESQIISVAKELYASSGLKIIFIAGPTCAGKTTTSRILVDTLTSLGKSVKAVSIDDFYLNRDDIPLINGKKDFESIASIDLELFRECANEILDGREVELPVFNFMTGCRSGYEKYSISENSVMLFEGIQAVYPEITSLFDDSTKKSIFLSIPDEIEVYGNTFTQNQIRFSRRVVRDSKFRNASPEYIYKLWIDVTENENKSIIPYKDSTDYKINTMMFYEFNVLKEYLFNLIKPDTMPDELAIFFKRLLYKYHDIPSITSKYVPTNSLFREFIG